MQNSSPKVILLDDDERMLALLGRVFRDFFGATILTATDPEDAYRAAIYSPPDLFVTDIVHPGASGVEIAQRLRKNKATKDINIWLVSGNVENLSDKEISKSGADLVCGKPCSLAYLIDSAKKIFDAKGVSTEVVLLNMGVESPGFDYKRCIDFDSKCGRAAFAKDVIAFANYGGGDIVVGVDEPEKGRFVNVGIDDDKSRFYEVTCLNKSISEYLDPHHHISSRIFTEGKKKYVLIRIPSIGEIPILAKKENPDAKLFLGRLYTRTSCAETKEITHAEELRALFERIVAARLPVGGRMARARKIFNK